MFTDPFGLKADTIEVQVHEVKILGVATGKYHASIRITPDNQERWAKDPRFQRGADGRVFATIGSAASAAGFTVSNLNRATDAAPHTLKQAINPGPGGEDAAIEKLFALDAAYQDNTIYSLGGSGPNSNSYAAGLLNAANLHRPGFPFPMPGYNAPIPARRFGVP